MPDQLELHETDALVMRILKARAEAIEQKLSDDPDATLSAVDLSVLKELRKVASEIAARESLEEEETQPTPDPEATQLGKALLDGDLKTCLRMVGEAAISGRSHPSVCGESVLRVITAGKT